MSQEVIEAADVSRQVDAVLAAEEQDRVVARLDHPNNPSEVELCRAISPELSASLISKLSVVLESEFPLGAALVRFVALDMAAALSQADYLPTDEVKRAALKAASGESTSSIEEPVTSDQVRARLQVEHRRAFDALRFHHFDYQAERAWLLIEHLRAAAKRVPRRRAYPKPPRIEDRFAWHALTREERGRQLDASRAWREATGATRTWLATEGTRLARAVFWRDGEVNGYAEYTPTEAEAEAGLDAAERASRSGEWVTALASIDSKTLRRWLTRLARGRRKQVGSPGFNGREAADVLSAVEIAAITRAVFPGWAASNVAADKRMGKARRARDDHYGLTRSKRAPKNRKSS
jgi:hypothetical protein